MIKVEANDYSQSFVDMMLLNKYLKGLTNLTAYQGDSHVQNQLTTEKFDLIFGCNLIDRLHTPIEWVRQSQVKKQLIIKQAGVELGQAQLKLELGFTSIKICCIELIN